MYLCVDERERKRKREEREREKREIYGNIYLLPDLLSDPLCQYCVTWDIDRSLTEYTAIDSKVTISFDN